MGNAIKFTEQGHITVSARAVDGKIQIAVRDTGIGIAADNMEKIFRHFEQADGGTARTYGGTGLGLSISKHLIELHGGQIWCESQLGRGSTFFFTLPASSVDAVEESPTISQLLQPPLVIETVENLAGHKSSSPSPSFEGQQIMVVDDEPLNLEVVSTQLMLHNFQAITAAGGPQALEVIERQGIPDLVLLDVMMPHMTGLEVCQTIRQTYSENELPIILLTAKNQIADLIAGFSSGANDYIIKPFSSQELIARIQNHIKIKNLTTEIILHRQNEARIEKDLEAARAVQETLLVPAPDVPDIQTMVYYRSADKTGGDWYGTFYDPHAQRVVVIIGDVTGHGVPAALITGVACGAIRGHFHTIGEASKEQPHLLLKNIANTLNQVIHETSYRSRKSITMAFLALDLPSGQVTYLNAGHPPIYHLAEGGLEVLLIPSHAIGAKQEPALETKQFIAQPGDVFFLFTDGLIENSGPDEARFNTRKLEKLLGASPLEPKAISEKLIEESKTIWQNHPPDDDCTFLILKYLGHNKKAHM